MINSEIIFLLYESVWINTLNPIPYCDMVFFYIDGTISLPKAFRSQRPEKYKCNP